MSYFQAKYSAEQKEAMALARLDRGLTAKKVVDQATNGLLPDSHGQLLPPFEPTVPTVYDAARTLKKRRRGELATGLADLDQNDAVEALRRRLLSVADSELRLIEKAKTPADLERLRQIVRVTREISALPGPNQGRTVQPGQRDPEAKRTAGGATTGGLAGSILAAVRSTGQPAPEPPTPQHTMAENTGPEPPQKNHKDNENHEDTTAPGSVQRREIGRSRLLSVPVR
jgi:hypothetical protein